MTRKDGGGGGGGASHVTPPKLRGCLEMAIATTASIGTPAIPPVWPRISHYVSSLGHKLHNLLIILVFQILFEVILWDSRFWDIG